MNVVMKVIDGYRIYQDRTEAGIALSELLVDYRDKHALILAIPRGGVVVGYEVARFIHGQLSVVITKKLPHPQQEELAIGALAEDGSVYLTSYSRSIDEDTMRNIIADQQREIEGRIRRFRDGKPLPEIRDRIVIIVDDGIATGSTIVPAIKLCRTRKAAKVIVAAPVSGQRYASEIDALADVVRVAEQPEDFYAVGQVYEDFHHLSDEEVTGLLKRAAHELRGNKDRKS